MAGRSNLAVPIRHDPDAVFEIRGEHARVLQQDEVQHEPGQSSGNRYHNLSHVYLGDFDQVLAARASPGNCSMSIYLMTCSS